MNYKSVIQSFDNTINICYVYFITTDFFLILIKSYHKHECILQALLNLYLPEVELFTDVIH